MPSRRRTANKNLSNNLAEVQRRLRTLERRPARSKLGNRSVTGAAIGSNAVDKDQVSFGVNLIQQRDDVTGLPVENLNPNDGDDKFDPSSGIKSTYSGEHGVYVPNNATDAVAQSIATLAAAAATDAQYTSSQALTTAGNKNRIFYAASEAAINTQASESSYTLKDGDLWFDTANDYRMSKRSSGAWGPFQLGDFAISALTAGKINAGEISLSKGITVVATLGSGSSSLTINNTGIAAVNNDGTQTFSINSSGDAYFGGSLTAGIKITAPIITGGVLRTDFANRRIEITDSDDMIFYGDTGTRSGTITSIGGTWSGDTNDPYVVPGGVMIYGGDSAVSNGSTTYPSIVASSDSVYMYGDAISRFSAKSSLLGMYGPEAYIYNDITTIYTGYSTTVTDGVTRPWHLYLRGRLRLSDSAEGPISFGTGVPATPTNPVEGQICFRYA